MTVVSIIGGGFRLVRTQPRVIAIWAALYLALMLTAMIVFRPMVASLLDFQREMATNKALGITTPPVFPAETFALLTVAELLFCMVVVMFFAAVVRAVTSSVGDRFAYLRVGIDEALLVALGLIFVIAMFVAEIVVVLALLIVGGLIGLLAGKAAGVGVALILGIVVFCAAIYSQIRLSLVGAFTVVRRKIVIRDAWRATKGHFWTLFGTYFLLGLGMFVGMILVLAITSPQLISAYLSFNPEAINAAAQQQIARQASGFSIGLIVQMAVGALFGVIFMAIYFGTIATAAVELGVIDESELLIPPSTQA